MCAAIREAGCEAPGSGLNETDRQDALRVMERLACNGTDPQCEVISQELRPILRHDFFAYALVRAYDERILRVVNLDFPGDFLDAIDFRAGSVTFKPLRKCLATRAPVVVRDVTQLLSGEGTATLRSWPSPLGALAVHAQMDSTGTRGLAFCFGNVPQNLIARCEVTLGFITPYLFSAIARTFWSRTKNVGVRPLSAREIEVIEWMYYGKTNEEISELLEISVHTVKNHVQKILLKLSAANRIQAVLRAADAGIVRCHDAGPTRPIT
jgi:DNA-binding CsgD family transcriptional regulator